VVEWQQMASHGRYVEGEDFESLVYKIGETRNKRSWITQKFVKVKENWRMRVIKPEVLYYTGDFKAIGRPDEGPNLRRKCRGVVKRGPRNLTRLMRAL
jgi:scytalone dehydratase